MKLRTIERLDLIAAEGERRLLDEITRHNATLAQVAQQRSVLASYRARLTESWRGGGVVAVGQARAAGHFISASHNADQQIDLMEAHARQLLALALDNLARAQAQRHELGEAQRRVLLEDARAAERIEERRQPWRAPPDQMGINK